MHWITNSVEAHNAAYFNQSTPEPITNKDECYNNIPVNNQHYKQTNKQLYLSKINPA